MIIDCKMYNVYSFKTKVFDFCLLGYLILRRKSQHSLVTKLGLTQPPKLITINQIQRNEGIKHNNCIMIYDASFHRLSSFFSEDYFI